MKAGHCCKVLIEQSRTKLKRFLIHQGLSPLSTRDQCARLWFLLRSYITSGFVAEHQIRVNNHLYQQLCPRLDHFHIPVWCVGQAILTALVLNVSEFKASPFWYPMLIL